MWSKDTVKKFIAEVKANRCLYDMQCVEYCNRDKRTEVWNSLLEVIKEFKPDVTIKIMKSKLKTLRTQYGRELRLIAMSKESGTELHVPKLWCFEELEFLQNHTHTRQSTVVHSEENSENETAAEISIEQLQACNENKSANKTLVEKETYCRACLRRGKNHCFLSDKYNETSTYLELFQEYTKLCPQPTERLCSICARKLFSFDEFICKARESDATLNELRTTNLRELSQSSDYNQELEESTCDSIKEKGPASSDDPLDDEENEEILEINNQTSNGDADNEILLAEVHVLDEIEIDEVLLQDHNFQNNSFIINTPTNADDYKFKERSRKTACNVCGKVLSSKTYLREHILIHTGQKNYLCTMCPKSFTNKSVFKKHIRTHTGERPYECKFCKKRFAHHTILSCHLRRHTGERPYSCDICGKRFIQTSNRNNHMKMVHGGKTIPCPHCDKKYARKIDLAIHLRSVSGEKPYACELCPNRYNQRGYLTEHMQRRHNSRHTNATEADDAINN